MPLEEDESMTKGGRAPSMISVAVRAICYGLAARATLIYRVFLSKDGYEGE